MYKTGCSAGEPYIAVGAVFKGSPLEAQDWGGQEDNRECLGGIAQNQEKPRPSLEWRN